MFWDVGAKPVVLVSLPWAVLGVVLDILGILRRASSGHEHEGAHQELNLTSKISRRYCITLSEQRVPFLGDIKIQENNNRRLWGGWNYV